MLSPLAFPALGAAAVLAVLAVLAFIGVTLLRPDAPEGWPKIKAPKLGGRHELATVPEPRRPRNWDAVLAEAYVTLPLPEITEEPEPIDELDPRWDWRAYADTQEETHELVAA